MMYKDRTALKAGKRWIVGAGAVMVLGTGGTLAYLLHLNQSDTPVPVRIIKVKRATVEDTINASGVIELGHQQTLKSPAEGAVEQVLVQPGDYVKAGQVLIVLRNAERRTATTDQQLKIKQQQGVLARSQQKMVEANEQIVAYREDLQLLQGLLNEGVIARTEVRDKQDQIHQTQVELREAAASAQEARLELERLQLENQMIQRQLQETVIIAPISGIVLAVNVNDGDGFEVRTDLLTLGNPDQELVKLQLSPLDAARTKVGQQARVSMIGPNPEIFNGHVVRLSPMAILPDETEGNPGGSEQSGQVMVSTLVRLNQPTHTLIPGSQVNVEIVLNSRENVIVLETEAVQRTETAPFVWIVDEQGHAQKRPVQLGLEGLTTVEVVKGLQLGDQVILPLPEVSLESGLSVVPE